VVTVEDYIHPPYITYTIQADTKEELRQAMMRIIQAYPPQGYGTKIMFEGMYSAEIRRELTCD